MTTQSNAQLGWVQANRSKRVRWCHVSASIERVAQRISAMGDAQATETIAARVAGMVDDAFRAHCRIALPDERTLVISVDRPAMVYAMRAQWLNRLGEGLPGRRRIVFEYGNAGTKLTNVEQQRYNQKR
jgi:hypothetical protein